MSPPYVLSYHEPTNRIPPERPGLEKGFREVLGFSIQKIPFHQCFPYTVIPESSV